MDTTHINYQDTNKLGYTSNCVPYCDSTVNKIFPISKRENELQAFVLFSYQNHWFYIVIGLLEVEIRFWWF